MVFSHLRPFLSWKSTGFSSTSKGLYIDYIHLKRCSLEEVIAETNSELSLMLDVADGARKTAAVHFSFFTTASGNGGKICHKCTSL